MEAPLEINELILNKKIETMRQSFNDIFHDEPFVYTAMALQSMGISDEQILNYLLADIKNINEYENAKFNEFKLRNNDTLINNVSNTTCEPENQKKI